MPCRHGQSVLKYFHLREAARRSLREIIVPQLKKRGDCDLIFVCLPVARLRRTGPDTLDRLRREGGDQRGLEHHY